MLRRPLVVVLVIVLVGGLVGVVSPAAAQRPGATVALAPLEPLGIDAERALRLEALFRAELERLAGRPLPPRDRLERDPELVACGGEPPCLAAAGRRLGVAQIIAGNIGQLGDSYVVNLKLVDVGGAAEVRRVSERLRGQPDELIEAVRIAAHRLLRPDEVRGQLAVLSDVPARLFVDGVEVGQTPLARPVAGLGVGTHELRVEAAGHAPWASAVEVHFQKTSQVVVQLGPGAAVEPASERKHSIFTSPWFWAATAAVAVVSGVLVGRALSPDPVIDCGASPGRCP